jgi:hypothetical protein
MSEEVNHDRRRLLGTAAMAIAAANTRSFYDNIRASGAK